jgi:hypothetical protein
MPAAGEPAVLFFPAKTARQLLVFMLVSATTEDENHFKFN